MVKIFWNSQGIVLIDYKEKSASITAEYNSGQLEKVKNARKEGGKGGESEPKLAAPRSLISAMVRL